MNLAKNKTLPVFKTLLDDSNELNERRNIEFKYYKNPVLLALTHSQLILKSLGMMSVNSMVDQETGKLQKIDPKILRHINKANLENIKTEEHDPDDDQEDDSTYYFDEEEGVWHDSETFEIVMDLPILSVYDGSREVYTRAEIERLANGESVDSTIYTHTYLTPSRIARSTYGPSLSHAQNISAILNEYQLGQNGQPRFIGDGKHAASLVNNDKDWLNGNNLAISVRTFTQGISQLQLTFSDVDDKIIKPDMQLFHAIYSISMLQAKQLNSEDLRNQYLEILRNDATIDDQTFEKLQRYLISHNFTNDRFLMMMEPDGKTLSIYTYPKSAANDLMKRMNYQGVLWSLPSADYETGAAIKYQPQSFSDLVKDKDKDRNLDKLPFGTGKYFKSSLPMFMPGYSAAVDVVKPIDMIVEDDFDAYLCTLLPGRRDSNWIFRQDDLAEDRKHDDHEPTEVYRLDDRHGDEATRYRRPETSKALYNLNYSYDSVHDIAEDMSMTLTALHELGMLYEGDYKNGKLDPRYGVTDKLYDILAKKVGFRPSITKIPADKMANLSEQLFNDTLKYLKSKSAVMFDNLSEDNFDGSKGMSTFMGVLNNLSASYKASIYDVYLDAFSYYDMDQRPSYYDQLFERKNVNLSLDSMKEVAAQERHKYRVDIKFNADSAVEPVTISQYENANKRSFDITGEFEKFEKQQAEIENKKSLAETARKGITEKMQVQKNIDKVAAVSALLGL